MLARTYTGFSRTARLVPRTTITAVRFNGERPGGVSSGKDSGFSVDRSGLLGGGKDMKELLNTQTLKESQEALWRLENGLAPSDEDSEDKIPPYVPPPNKEEMTVLAADLHDYIGVRGPISVQDYMLQCSNHFVHGYYQTSASKIGAGGDFVTAPEMSQLFGEMIGMWCLSHWMSLGKPRKIAVCEMGPGKGTLMKDILKVAARFPDFQAALQVHMVELSENMRKQQRAALGCAEDAGTVATAMAAQTPLRSTTFDVPVFWHHALQQVPQDENIPILAIGQEFLDAFPVHQFEYRKGEWKEKLVDVCKSAESDYHFRYVLSPSATPAVRALLSAVSGRGDAADMVAHAEGETMEVSPLALATCEAIGARICRSGGAALLIDYGENYTQGDSLRGFRKHQMVHALSSPGITDVTVDVDFAACARAAAKRGAVAIGAIPQGEFLIRMGVVDRVQQLLALKTTTDDAAVKMLSSLRRLVDAQDMGKRFKVLAILDPRNEINTIGFPDVKL